VVSDNDEKPAIGGGRMSVVLFVVIALLMAIDLAIDVRRGESIVTNWFELGIFGSALAGIAFHWYQMSAARRRSELLNAALASARAELLRSNADVRRWNAEAQPVLDGLGRAIDRQFDRWGLTPAEREVALLQLKGLRHRAIAELRHTSERTVRQQALAVYRKSGLDGRSDLAAFFLEDLLLPGQNAASYVE
jgi:DNA-binding NarL/FixJ family response regulator